MNRRHVAAFLAGFALVAGGVVGAPATAFAATGPLCKGTSCFNRDPYAEQCTSGAYAVSSQYIAVISANIDPQNDSTGFGYLRLIYSPACNANWAEFDGYPSGYDFELDAWNNEEGPTGPVDQWKSAGDEVAWTNMVDGSVSADVGVCESTTGGAVVNVAYLMQNSGDHYACFEGGGAGITW